MRYLVVYAHPVGDSFVAALHRCVVKTLREAGHTVDDCDLNAEGFQPVLSEAERRAYHDVGANRASIEKEIERPPTARAWSSSFPPGGTGCPPS
jgi:NAD(P)H dehydrogenase (quinone)